MSIEGLNAIKVSLAHLSDYVSDREALENMNELLNKKGYIDVILPNLGYRQKEQLEYIISGKNKN